MKKVIVTGANGFLGSYLVRRLIDEDIFVYALIRNSSDKLNDISNDKICIIRDIEEVGEDNIDVLYHFAWSGNSGKLRGDIKIQQNNIEYACEILQYAAKIGCKKFIYAGSVMEYEALKILDDNSDFGMGYIYSTSKLTADLYLKILSNKLDIDFATLIISNIYGPKEKSDRLINTTIKKLLKGEETAISTGEQLYDFIYISDAIEKIYALGKISGLNGSYYIGNTIQKPLRSYLETIGEICINSKEIGIGKLGKSSQVIDYSKIDVSRIERELNVFNKISFEEGIKNTKEYLEEEINAGI